MVHVRTCRSAAAALTATGEAVAAALIAVDKKTGRSRLAISGGSAAGAMAAVLANLPDGVRTRLHLTWIDERCVPIADKESNRGAALRAGWIPDDCAVELPLWWDDVDVAEALARASAGLRVGFGSTLDVALLGLGEDGHIASLFPGHATLAAGGLVVHEPDSPKPPAARMSLTLPLLQRVAVNIMVATGEGKRAALQRLRRGDPALPGSALAELSIFTDLELEDKA